MRTQSRILLLLTISLLSVFTASATPPNVVVKEPYPTKALEGAQTPIYFYFNGLGRPQAPDSLVVCGFSIINHDNLHSYTFPYGIDYEVPFYAAPGYYKVQMNVCGPGGSFDFYSADSIFYIIPNSIIPNDFKGCSVSLFPSEVPADSTMEITATISGENGAPATFDDLNIGTDSASRITQVKLFKDGEDSYIHMSYSHSSNQIKSQIDFTDVDTGMYYMRIERRYECGAAVSIWGEKPIHVTNSTITPYIESFVPSKIEQGESSILFITIIYPPFGFGHSDLPDKKIKRIYLANQQSDTIEIVQYIHYHNDITGHISIPYSAKPGTYSIYMELLTDNGLQVLTHKTDKCTITKKSISDRVLSVEPKEIMCGDSVTLTVKCSGKCKAESNFSCYLSEDSDTEHYPASDIVFLSDSVFSCRVCVPETLCTQQGSIMLKSKGKTFDGFAELVFKRRPYRLSISPDSVVAGDSVFLDIKVSNLGDSTRFANAIPKRVMVSLGWRKYYADSVEYFNDSTLRCRFAFPFVAEMEPISISLKYSFGTFDVAAEQLFTVFPAMKIASTNIDTVIGSSDGSIIITTTDDNFEKSDIKSITFTSDEISSTQIIKGGTYRKKFTAYKFEKVGPKQLQAWFYASYEDSSRVYYLSIMKTDSTVWLPTEGQKIVVINALLGAEDANCDGLIRVEPNPANSDSYLVFGAGLVGETELAIVGMDGSETKTRLVVNNQTAETKLPLSDFVCSPGVYLIRCTNGAKSQTIKTVFLK